jgi:hypothetical protein
LESSRSVVPKSNSISMSISSVRLKIVTRRHAAGHVEGAQRRFKARSACPRGRAMLRRNLQAAAELLEIDLRTIQARLGAGGLSFLGAKW